MKKTALTILFFSLVLAIHAQNKFIDILPEMTVIDGELWVLTIDGPSGAAIWKKYKASVMKEYITPYPLPTTAGTDGQGIVFDTGTGAFIYADLTYQQDFLDSLAAIRADLPAAATTNTVHVIATLGDTTTIISPVEADIAWVSSDTIAFRDDAQWRVFLGGSSTVNTDATLAGDGSVGSPLGVDSTVMASLSALQDTAAAIRADIPTGNEAITLSGDVTGTGTTAITTTISAGVVGPNELENTAVTPGAYTNANITVDGDGRITSAANGSSVGAGSGSIYILYAEDFYTSDWAAAINTAIDSLNGLGGGTVILPPDTLSLTRQTTTGTNDYCILLKDNVQLTGHPLSTVLRLANTQINDTYPTTHIIHGVELKNSSVSNLQIIGNTTGQSGYTGGYQQAASAGAGIYLKGGTGGARGDKFMLRNVKIYDTFGAAATLQFTNNVHVENYEAWNAGELLEVGWSINVIANNIYVNTTFAGDGIEFAHTENLQLTNFIAENVDFGYACDIYGVTEGHISGGVLKASNGGLNLHHTLAEPPPDGFMDSLYNLIVSDVLAIDNVTYGLDMIAENLTNVTINNFVSRNNTSGGLIAGYSSGYGPNWSAKFYDCDFSENGGPGAYTYDPVLIEFYNCNFNGNAAQGISHNGPALITSDQDSVGTLNVWGGQIRNNTLSAVVVANAPVKPVMTIEAYMEGNNPATAGASVNRNIKNDGVSSEFVKVRNLRPQMDAPAFSTQYVYGEKRVIFSTGTGVANLQTELEDNQVIELYADTTTVVVNDYDNFDIRTISGANTTMNKGDILTLVFDADSIGWFVRTGESLWQQINDTTLIAATAIKRVGINDATPAATLDVGGDLRVDGSFIDSGADNGTAGTILTSTGTGTDWAEFTAQTVTDPTTTTPQTLQTTLNALWTKNYWRASSPYITHAGLTGGGTVFMKADQMFTTASTWQMGTNGVGSAFYINNPVSNYVLNIENSRVGINDNTPDFSLDIETTDALKLPVGTTAQRPGSPVVGVMRYNSDLTRVEYHTGSEYLMVSTGKKLVEANTAGSGTPNALTADESERVLTNEGSTAQNYHTLPTAAAGLTYTFVVQDSDGIRIVANTGDTIRVAGTVSASAGYTESTTIGDVITLVAINATEWIAISYVGTWTII